MSNIFQAQLSSHLLSLPGERRRRKVILASANTTNMIVRLVCHPRARHWQRARHGSRAFVVMQLNLWKTTETKKAEEGGNRGRVPECRTECGAGQKMAPADRGAISKHIPSGDCSPEYSRSRTIPPAPVFLRLRAAFVLLTLALKVRGNSNPF